MERFDWRSSPETSDSWRNAGAANVLGQMFYDGVKIRYICFSLKCYDDFFIVCCCLVIQCTAFSVLAFMMLDCLYRVPCYDWENTLIILFISFIITILGVVQSILKYFPLIKLHWSIVNILLPKVLNTLRIVNYPYYFGTCFRIISEILMIDRYRIYIFFC